MSKLKDGFNTNISNLVYHGDRKYSSSSALKLMYKNPREYYRKYVLNEKEEMNTAALDLGSYVHAAILEPHLIDKEFAVFEGASRRGNAWSEFEEANKGKTIITKSMYNKAKLMIDKFKEDKLIIGKDENEKEVPTSHLYTGGKPEETLCGELEGLPIKVRFDYRVEDDTYGSIFDVKTTGEDIRTCQLYRLECICRMYDYDLSAALYVDMATKITGKPHDFYFTFISKNDYGVRTVKASQQMLEKGREKYRKAIQLLKDAKATNIYYKNVIEEINSLD